MSDEQDSMLTRRAWMRRTAASGATLLLGAGAYAWQIEPYWVQVTQLPMPLPGLGKELVGKRLVQVSDLHIGPVVDDQYMKTALGKLVELHPDYLVVTGDFMTSQHGEQVEKVLATVEDSPLGEVPTLACFGNHDYSSNFRDKHVADRLAEGLEERGVRVLRNEHTVVEGLQFFASDDLWANRCHVFNSQIGADHSLPSVYLAHNPDIADVRGWGDFRGWILSGHTHGGQCRLPLVGAPVLPVRNRAYGAGYVDLQDGRHLYVNRGLGYKAPLRFGVRPEITVFTLQAA